MTSLEERTFQVTTETTRYLTGYGGRAKFIDGALVDICWTPPDGMGLREKDGLYLSAENTHRFPSLMQFLRRVEQAWLEIEHGTRLVANDGLQLWIQKEEGSSLKDAVPYWSEVYRERHALKPNVLVVSQDETDDTSFWEGKVLRVSYLLPIHFRLSYQVQDAEKETE